MKFLQPWQPQILSILRVMSAALLLQHGTAKHLDFPSGPMNAVELASVPGVAGLIELVGGLLLLVGLFTRPVAFVLSGLMAFAYFLAHAPQGFFPILNGGELAALYCFAFLFLASAGGGAWSLDRALGRVKTRTIVASCPSTKHSSPSAAASSMPSPSAQPASVGIRSRD